MDQAPQLYQQQEQQQVRIAETGVLYTAAGQPVAITSPTNASTYESYRSRQSLIVGIILIIAGALSLTIDGISIGLFKHTFMGIGNGILYIIAGSFGVASASKKKRCLIIASMVLDVISATGALIAFLMYILAMIAALRGFRGGHGHDMGVIYALMAVLDLIAGIAAIWGSALGCKVTCCGRQTTAMVLGSNQPVVYFAQQPQQPYFSVPQAEPLIATNPGAPPAYTSGYPLASSQQQQSMTSPAGYYSSSPYNPAVVPPPVGASGLPPPSVHDDKLPLSK